MFVPFSATSIFMCCVVIGRVLSKHDIRGMPVVDKEGKVLGLISYKEVTDSRIGIDLIVECTTIPSGRSSI